MAGEVMVFFGKYSGLVGPPTVATQFHYSDPFEVVGSKQVDIEVFVAGITGAGTVVATPETSSDMITWTAGTPTAALGGNTLATLSITSPARYLRLRITHSATGIVASLWAKGVGRDC